MNKKNKAISIVIIVTVTAGFYFYFIQKNREFSSIKTFKECVDAGYKIIETYPEQCKAGAYTFTNPDQSISDPPNLDVPVGKKGLIWVDDIKENQLVKSPLLINGRAVGTWYFESSFPLELKDGNDRRITIIPVQAKGDWMTTDFVPFSTVLTFEKPTTATGTLIFHKDNPSGEPSRNDSLAIPVRFI